MAMRSDIINKYAVSPFILRSTTPNPFLVKDTIHAPHEVSWTVTQPERASDVLIIAKGRPKGSDLLTFRLDKNLPKASFEVGCAKEAGISKAVKYCLRIG